MLPRVSRCLSAIGVRFSGRPAPAEELGLPHGRLTNTARQHGAGPHRGCHVPLAWDSTG